MPPRSAANFSTDHGQTWTWANWGHADYNAFGFDSTGRLWIGNDGGVWRRSAGGTLENLNSTLPLAQFEWGIAGEADTDGPIFGGTQDTAVVVRKPDGSWRHFVGGDGGAVAWRASQPNVVYAGVLLRLRHEIDGRRRDVRRQRLVRPPKQGGPRRVLQLPPAARHGPERHAAPLLRLDARVADDGRRGDVGPDQPPLRLRPGVRRTGDRRDNEPGRPLRRHEQRTAGADDERDCGLADAGPRRRRTGSPTGRSPRSRRGRGRPALPTSPRAASTRPAEADTSSGRPTPAPTGRTSRRICRTPRSTRSRPTGERRPRRSTQEPMSASSGRRTAA